MKTKTEWVEVDDYTTRNFYTNPNSSLFNDKPSTLQLRTAKGFQTVLRTLVELAPSEDEKCKGCGK